MAMENIEAAYKVYLDPQALLHEVEVKSNNVVDVLNAAHARVSALFTAFESADENLKRALCTEIITALSVHANLEEVLIYPILLTLNEDKTREAHEEHHLVKLALAELAELSATSAEAKAKMKVLSEMVKHHIKEEETNLLPMLKETNLNLEELGCRFKTRRDEMLEHIQKVGEKSEETGGGVCEHDGSLPYRLANGHVTL